MKHLSKNQSKTKAVLYGIAGILSISTIIVSGVFNSLATHADSQTSNVSVVVNSACTITTGGGSYVKTISPGTTDTITGNGINVTCNDNNGYDLYAVGFSDDTYDSGDNNKMIAISSSDYIPTATSGNDSYWAMKATGSSNISTTPTIDNSFNNYHTVPSEYTRISYYTGATIGTTANSITTPTYQVYVSSSQPAGTYTGKVKYTLVHPHDVDTGADTYMQNWTGCSSLAIGSETFLKDSRDDQFYSVVKFNDGKCWMTTNLNLAGGTALSAADTDVDSDYIGSFETGNNLTKSGDTIVLPESSTTGFDANNYSYVYNSGSTTCGSDSPCYSYYSWDAATLGSGRSIATGNTDAPYSICPAGWHLPNTRGGTNSTSDFRSLMIALGGSASITTYNSSTSPTGTEISSPLRTAPLNFSLAGHYSSGSFGKGGYLGVYWSSTGSSSESSLYLDLYEYQVSAAFAFDRDRALGFSVRCIADQ